MLFNPPLHLLNDIEVKVTDLYIFMINEMSISHQLVIGKYSSFIYKNLGGSASIPVYLTSISHQKVFIFQI